MRGLAATLTGLCMLIAFGGVLARDILFSLPTLEFQSAILAVILSSLSTSLTPLSSAFGAFTYVPPSQTPVQLGIWPLIAWIAVGVMVGLLTQKPSESVIPSLLTPTITYISVVGLAGYVLPRIPSATNWEIYLTKLAQQIILEGPLDFAFLFAVPITFSLITASMAELASPKPVVTTVSRRRRFLHWPEEE
ncbi:MAG: hypothetical protein QXG52_05615 [Candidatus Caldarchaeum sp.]